MSLLIKNGRVIDPANQKDEVCDILIEDDVITKVEAEIEDSADQTIDAKGLVVMPGLIDIDVNFCEPGYEHKETIKTGSQAAAKGGFTTVCTMPETMPVMDSVDMLDNLYDRLRANSIINVLPVSAMTMGLGGEYLVDVKGMAAGGAVAISECNNHITNLALYRKAMFEAKNNNVIVMAHCLEKNLAGRGVLNEGVRSKELGVLGIPSVAEDVIVARDMMLAKDTGAKLHICQCSTSGSVDTIRYAKDMGVNITGEVSPHHLILCDEDIPGNDSNYKVTPPLRSSKDRTDLRKALKDGTIEVISSGHAPHHSSEKQMPLSAAPSGVSEIEISFSLCLTEVVEKGILTLSELIEKMSVNPAKIIGIDRGTLGVGKKADITIMDTTALYTIDPGKFLSMGKNTPFAGKEVKGITEYTIVGGQVVYQK